MADDKLSKKEIKFWRSEMKMLDTLYADRMKEWSRLSESYDLKFKQRIRDLDPDDIVEVSTFIEEVRGIIGNVAKNHPRQLFHVDDDESGKAGDTLEAASAAYFELTHIKPHMHQAIFDALFCGVGWIRVDYNPAGDDMIAPYVANDVMEEDFVALSRVAPGFVHVDPTCSPHMLGHARYIREKLWMPLEFLLDDDEIDNKAQLKGGFSNTKKEDLGFGEVLGLAPGGPEEQALRSAMDNGEYVLVDRIHDRIGKRQIMFVDSVDEPIQVKRHWAAKMDIPQMQDPTTGQPMFDIDQDGNSTEPIFDIEMADKAPGWLVQHGFPFIPIKFDLHGSSFYPKGHLRYLEDIQNGIIEQVSRRADILKGAARQMGTTESEVKANPELPEQYRRGKDGEMLIFQNRNNVFEIPSSSVPSDLYSHENSLLSYKNRLSRAGLSPEAPSSRTATQTAVLASGDQRDVETMLTAVEQGYEDATRNGFAILGDPRYSSKIFNVSIGTGSAILLRTSDFLWTYRIQTKTGSTTSLWEQLEQDKALAFWDRASTRQSFDPRKLDVMLATTFGVDDPDSLMTPKQNIDAIRAAQLENQRIITQMSDPGVVQGQDHVAHVESGHSKYREDPTYAAILQQAQSEAAQGIQGGAATMRMQQVDALIQQHVRAHQQMAQQSTSSASGDAPITGLQSQVASNAQEVASEIKAAAGQEGGF